MRFQGINFCRPETFRGDGRVTAVSARSASDYGRHTPRMRVSSTPRPLDSITAVSGILDRPVEPGDDGWSVARSYRK
jgi:hypothetical protein